jgi:hypothetical protein
VAEFITEKQYINERDVRELDVISTIHYKKNDEESLVDCEECSSPNEIVSENYLTDQNLTPGMILGIHNIFIVLPQFFSSLVSSLIFKISSPGYQSFEYIWAFGSIFSMVAAFLASITYKYKNT